MERAPVRGLRLLLATLLCAIGLMVGSGPTARAEEPVPLVSITIDAINPSLPERDGTISLAGRVTNITDQPLFRLQAIFWRNQAPITGREEFDQALISASNQPFGSRVFGASTPGYYQDLYAPNALYLDPGETVPFTVQAKISDLALSPTSGVYLMGVHVLQNGVPSAVGRARVFVPVLDSPPRNTLQLTSVVILTSRPAVISREIFVDDHLATEIAPGGRLYALLDAARQPDMTYAVDPALIEELKAMRDGYQVLSANGFTVAGSGAPDAGRWLEQFATLAADQDGYRLPYASPDIAAAAHSRSESFLERGAEAAKAVPETAELPLLVMPADGLADADTLRAAEGLDPRAILLSDASTSATAPLLAGSGSAPIVSFTSAAFGGGPGPEPSNTAVHLQQRMLADTWIEASTRPAGSTLGRVRVITNAAQALGDDGSQKVPWMKRTTLTQLLGSTPTSWDQTLRYTEDMAANELSPQHLQSSTALATSYDTYAELLVDSDLGRVAANRALARSVSAGWRGQPEAAGAFVRPQRRELTAILRDGVQLATTPQVTTSGARGVFPITVLNRLPGSDESDLNAIQVRIRFTSDNTQRVNIEGLVSDVIPPQRNFSGTAQVNASTNGTVRVRAQATTLSGVPVGRPINIDVKVTQAGTVGWFIAVGAGIVLIGGTALRIRQVAQERGAAADGDAPGSDDDRTQQTTSNGIAPPPVTPPVTPAVTPPGVEQLSVRTPHDD